MSFTTVHVKCSEPDYMDISWSFDNGKYDSLSYTYTVERSESPAGPYDTVAGPMRDRYSARDYIAPRKRVWRSLYYRISAEGPEGTVTSEPTLCGPRPPLDGLEMTRLHNVLLREYVGRQCAVLSIRTFGDRCHTCYDNLTGRRTMSSCKTCWNTGFLRGYHKPILAYIQIDPSDKAQTNGRELVSEQVFANSRMGIYPIIKPRDIIVEREGNKWRVNSVRQTERLRSPIHQEVSLTLIPPGDIEYKIPLKFPEDTEVRRAYSYKDDL